MTRSQKYIHDDDFTKEYERTSYKVTSTFPASRSGSHQASYFCMPLSQLVILEGWKAQSLSAQNHSMARGSLAGIFEKDYVLPDCILSDRHV